jgi:hypothetical protein
MASSLDSAAGGGVAADHLRVCWYADRFPATDTADERHKWLKQSPWRHCARFANGHSYRDRNPDGHADSADRRYHYFLGGHHTAQFIEQHDIVP